MMQSPSLLWFELFSVLVEVLFFGAFCVLFTIAIWILVHRRHRGRRPRSPNLWLIAIVTIMFLCAGTYVGIDVYFTLVAFVNHSATPGGPLAYFQHEGDDPSRTVSAVIFAFQTLLGDGFMAYRVFVVWNRKPISLVLPGLLLVGDVVTTGVVGHALLQGGPTSSLDVVFVPEGRSALTAYFVMTLLTNICTTLLLFGRLWFYDRRTRRYLTREMHTSASWRVMKTIMQSQALYSVGVILNLVAFLSNSNLVLITDAILPPLIGISFTLIIIRIGLDEALGTSHGCSGESSNAMELSERGRAASPIAVNVFISHTDDRSENVRVRGHSKSPAALP